ncbi:hypothetical protein E1293_22285 [Actinomadura darangshiensis]|uniref:Uncharacterized protein n=1 Tax=Actinomadura darangshiensis TaxID=705336 RepID=A0A4R5B2A9_9ACTN|nr:hypothetical protein [Actinomadura darangshiensis]TDD79841.1 hypothetical protein E1293_22285 [Actinomadura darangshiensis]
MIIRIGMGPAASTLGPDELSALALGLEREGFDSLWVSERVTGPALCLLQRPWRRALGALLSAGAAAIASIAPARLAARCAIRFSQARTWLRTRSHAVRLLRG